ncbi:UDP-N-acetylglucosamine 2-epimerase (non-hydrolyzing) [Algoriphagus sp. oki45]|uniref:non-hydrolyzing UDP-N-acetylglucosamine 2-epimerase n=1 Tax=Algoriphagus sp. oki45 TaxID=3067294 RepID=UPI0027EEE932|nr:UDP-N-acetylglucosamine 2-epimerase (non-hydrolyzing) [Algoriphagus sp. oki45]
MKILTILGARPQFIKAASLSRVLKSNPIIQEIIVHTGQHYDPNMSDVFFKELSIPKANFYLGIGGTSHGAMTGKMIEKIEEIAILEKPDWILVYGDTNSTLAGAIVASKLHINLAHVEAGLRSFNMNMPEEVNRILTDRVSNILFCPTDQAVLNLEKEGFNNFNCSIINSGDIMLDGILFYGNLCKRPNEISTNNFALATIHRAENTDSKDRLESILSALNEINKEINIILPLHPRTKNKIKEFGIQVDFEVIDPVGYLEMIWLIKNSSIVLTDSGGLQKEAYFLNKPCVTLRDETEWIELVNSGFNILTGCEKDKIVMAYNKLINFNFSSNNLYGNGNTSKIIMDSLLSY